MLDYDHLRAYLADNGTLRWSYGSIKGRPNADWQVKLRVRGRSHWCTACPPGPGLHRAVDDTQGLHQRGKEIDEIIAAVGVEPIRSSDGRFLFLRDFERRTDMSDAELRQAAIDTLGVTPPEEAPSHHHPPGPSPARRVHDTRPPTRSSRSCSSRRSSTPTAATASPKGKGGRAARLITGFGLVLGGAAVFFVVWRLIDDWPEVQPYLEDADVAWLVAAGAFAVLGMTSIGWGGAT